MKKTIVVIGVFALSFGCKKEDQTFCTDAAVIWGGDPDADGLGWYLIADSVNHIYYIPQNLTDSLKIDGQLVNVCLYKTKENFYCECPRALKKYHIIAIKKL